MYGSCRIFEKTESPAVSSLYGRTIEFRIVIAGDAVTTEETKRTKGEEKEVSRGWASIPAVL